MCGFVHSFDNLFVHWHRDGAFVQTRPHNVKLKFIILIYPFASKWEWNSITFIVMSDEGVVGIVFSQLFMIMINNIIAYGIDDERKCYPMKQSNILK